MSEVLICVVVVLALLYLVGPSMLSKKENTDSKDLNTGYATSAPSNHVANSDESNANYNDYLQSVALDPTIQEQHKGWVNDLMLNYQPRMYSVRDDCLDGENKRVGLLRTDYSNVINENQNISVPSGRICTEGDGGNSRFGGYGISLFPVQRP